MIICYDSVRAAASPVYLSCIKVIYDRCKYEDPVTYTFTSRYSASRVIQDSDHKNKKYHESINETSIPESESDVYIITDKADEDRLDIISNKAYGSPLYWWVIAMANNITDPFSISMGSTLRVPPISSIYGVKGLMRL